MSRKLAIHGGIPTRKKLLPYGHQWIDNSDIKAVTEVLKTDWITQGPKVKEFEELISKYCNVTYAVAFSSGTAALHGAIFSVGLQQGDEVITTPITFVADGNCTVYQGGIVRLADIQSDTLNIEPKNIIKKITNKTKALIPVDFAGHPCDYDEIHEIASDHSLPVIEDAAHALGAEYRGKKIGGLSDLTVLSFHPVKTITTGEGGMVLTNNHDYYERLLLFRTHGIIKDDRKLQNNEGSWYYEMQKLGYNYRLTDFQCALGISQLKKIDSFISRRRELVYRFNKEFQNIPELIVPIEKNFVQSAWHLYVLQLHLEKLTVNRKTIFDALRAENIGVQVHYIPIHYQPFYQHTFGYKKGDFPLAEQYYNRTITLPLFPQMTNNDADDVIDAVQKVIHHYRKD